MRKECIKVANGTVHVAKKAVTLRLHIGGVLTEPLVFRILDGLPYDFLLGTATMKTWKTKMDWETQSMSFETKTKAKGAIQWSTHTGRHWRGALAWK